jgi:Cu/Zn superoxide dismutase
MMPRTSRFALHIKVANADLRVLQEKDALVGTTNVTRADASGTSLFTCAITRTEYGMQQFHLHRIQRCLFLSNFLQAMGAYHVLRYKVAFQF